MSEISYPDIDFGTELGVAIMLCFFVLTIYQIYSR